MSEQTKAARGSGWLNGDSLSHLAKMSVETASCVGFRTDVALHAVDCHHSLTPRRVREVGTAPQRPPSL